jgi:hypothetical protein
MDKKRVSTNYPVHRAASRLGALLFACLSGSAAAESLFLGGAEASSDTQYAFIAAIVPFPGSNLGSGFVQRYWLEGLKYEYESNDRVIEAEADGAEAAIGYQKAHAGGYVAGYLGAYYKDTELSPDDPTARVRGAQLRARTQLEADQKLGSLWRVNAIASYVLVQESYWSRLRLLRNVRNQVWAGVEGIAHGDPDYQGKQVALVLTGLEPAPRVNLGVKVGASHIEGRQTELVIGFELGRPFGKSPQPATPEPTAPPVAR